MAMRLIRPLIRFDARQLDAIRYARGASYAIIAVIIATYFAMMPLFMHYATLDARISLYLLPITPLVVI